MIERLRYFVFEVPKQFWVIQPDNLRSVPVLLWDSEEYKRHHPSYSGPRGKFYCALDGTRDIVSLVFEVKFELPRFPPIIWRHCMNTSDLESDVDDIRNRVVAEISLEVDHLQSPEEEPSDVLNDSLPIT